MSNAAAYADTRVRIIELLRACTDGELGTRAPATPAWSVRDLAAHVTGIAVDVTTGNLEGLGSDPWTEAQVAARRPLAMEDVITEWEVAAAKVEEGLDEWPGASGSFIVADLATHEQDIRGALRRPGGEGSPGFDIALQLYVAGVDRRLRKRGLPAMRISAGTDEWLLGEGAPAATLTATPYELFRAVAGRRSKRQTASYDWSGKADQVLEAIPQFPYAAEDIVEV
ncbi:MAG TPA: maleylpyruvate isomerase family mycothiol-dependent enzyme [Acidimicrobiales bacterium]|nr:maleylpyruvate isomerase family mycothiol-dependent enzyme [Acidimicrobiales bacterium]